MTKIKRNLDPLTPRLEEALILSGKNKSAFGYIHFGDPAFVKKMREGRNFRPAMATKIETVLREEYGL